MRAPRGRSHMLMLMHHWLTCTCSCWARARAYVGTAGQVWTSRTCATSSTTTCRAAVRTMSIGLVALDEQAPQARSHMQHTSLIHMSMHVHVSLIHVGLCIYLRVYICTTGQVTYAHAHAPLDTTRAHVCAQAGTCSCLCGHRGAGRLCLC